LGGIVSIPYSEGGRVHLRRSAEHAGDRSEDGFTLIELMVVLLIIAVLLAIAIPTFLGARNRSNARATQENLRNALTSEQVNWTLNQMFATNLSGDEPSTAWLTSAPTTPGQNGVYATIYAETVSGSSLSTAAASSIQADGVDLVGYGKDNNCYAIYQSDNASLDFTAYRQWSPVSGTCSTPAPPDAAPATGSQASSSGTWSATF
jgi:type IV pilus assembly protein PilA